MIGGSQVTCWTYLQLSQGQNFTCSGRSTTIGPTRAAKWSTAGFSIERHAVTTVINEVFEGIETPVVKYLYDDDFVPLYLSKATTMIKSKIQGAIDTLEENTNSCLLYTSRCV